MMSQHKRIRKNNNFRPCSVDENDELFPNGVFEFNITKIVDFIQINKQKIILENIEVKSYRARFTGNNLNEATVESADLSVPLILAQISPMGFNVIDGHHRLEKAYRLGTISLPAYKLVVPQHIAFLTSQEAYFPYIKYWNSKIEEMKSDE